MQKTNPNCYIMTKTFFKPIGFLLFGILVVLSACKNNRTTATSSENSSSGRSTEPAGIISSRSSTYFAHGSSSSEYEDGSYCATVEYYNPNSGTESTYTLTVEVEDNEVTQINFPNGGWLDDSHFTPEELDDDGSVSFT